MAQSNIHGLDFLRRDHILNEEGRPYQPAVANAAFNSSKAWNDDDDDDDNNGNNHLAEMVANKPDLEKQFIVIHFLQAHRSAGYLAPSFIYEKTGVDLQESVAVAEMLRHNPKIRVELVPDPENPSLLIDTYAYQAKYNHVRDNKTLLAQINRCKNGVPMRDLEDSYDGVEVDLAALITAGDVVAVNNTEDKDKIIFPRGEAFLVELDGLVQIPENFMRSNKSSKSKSATASSSSPSSKKESKNGKKKEKDGKADDDDKKEKLTDEEKDGKDEKSSKEDKADANKNNNGDKDDVTGTIQEDLSKITHDVVWLDVDLDPQTQVRRGEAIQVGGQWFRVSSAVKDGKLSDQPARAQAPLSVVSLADLSKRNEADGYIRPFSDRDLPIDDKLSKVALSNVLKANKTREFLHQKLGHVRSGGPAGQLLNSHAHAANPSVLAQSLGSVTTKARKRPNKAGTANQQSKVDIERAKEAALDPNFHLYSHARRHGCTRDIRELYLATRKLIPKSDADVHKMLHEHKLVHPGEQLRRPRLKRKTNVDGQGKPKKRRYYERKNQRMTNLHLVGTETGAILQRAYEKQKQGEQVGDGGM